jgi:hypothetical protein
MKVLDLACSFGHGFEGWFASEDDFQSQLARGLVQCPMCDNAEIIKKLSAPRLNLSSARDSASKSAEQIPAARQNATDSIASGADIATPTSQNGLNSAVSHAEAHHPLQALMRNPEFQAAYMQMAKEVLAKTEDVGEDFAREARKIHYGESKERGIRGQTTRDEALELLDEGIDVMPLPLPKALKGPLQ